MHGILYLSYVRLFILMHSNTKGVIRIATNHCPHHNDFSQYAVSTCMMWEKSPSPGRFRAHEYLPISTK